MHIEENGPESGTPIVFLHGSMVGGWMWTDQVAMLSGTYRTIVPDLPGIGASASEQWTNFAGVADSVAAEVSRRCPDGAHIVGLSLGGIIALNLATSHPEVCRSLLVSGVPIGRLPLPIRLLNRVLTAAYGTRFGARMIGRIFGLPDAESMDAFIATAAETDQRAIKAISSEAESKPLPLGLDQVRLPVLAVVGEKDTGPARRAVPWLVATMPDATGAEVPGVRHQWNAEDPQLFSDMTRRWIVDQEVHPNLTPVEGALEYD